ncbi:ciliary microtubule-associated protein 3 [Elgaria multicarinata webbii]|uniref:ciliary microtubule-associated protein 3 n=1 Tax=Elgaria multicarinata webbii TaxID=159646 RepID=UPI002FCD12AD
MTKQISPNFSRPARAAFFPAPRSEAPARRPFSPIFCQEPSPAPFPWQLMGLTHMNSVRTMFSGQRQLAWELTEAQKRTSFGTCQEKKIFPFFYAPDRLGNEYVPIRGDTHRGPGTYNHGERSTLLYLLANRPESIKGYTLGARTTPRFGLISKHATPCPTTYQAIWIKDHKRSNIPFRSNSPRFSGRIPDKEFFPGPGTYEPNKMPHRHVTWPGKFGSPDWSLIPTPVKRTLRTELLSDKEFRKQRNLLAYLSLYYDD